MLRIVIVDQLQIAKDVIFKLHDILKDQFTFTYYEKITDLIKASPKDYDVIVLNETYNNARITNALDFEKTNSILIYLCHESNMSKNNAYGRVFYINSNDVETDLLANQMAINGRLMKHKEYLFSYNGITLRLKFHDIFYIEKDDKNLIYYTKKGKFYERGSISQKERAFLDYDFIRVNNGIIVNYEYIFKIDGDELELHTHERLPISRARRPKVLQFVRAKTA